jgi:hypothetical protein
MERRNLAGCASWCGWSTCPVAKGQVTLSKWHPRLVLRESDIEVEAELMFMESHGAGLFKVGVRVDESGASRARRIRRMGEWLGYPSN